MTQVLAPASPLLSCGILVRSPAGWLLAHATRTPRWDIPKGKCEPGETPWETVVRETREEIGLDVQAYTPLVHDLGRHPYLPKKDLHLFSLNIDTPWDLSACGCTTEVTGRPGCPYPETDAYAWIPEDQVPAHIGWGLYRYMVRLGLLADTHTTKSAHRKVSIKKSV